jgi:hypothetical protein
MLFVMAILSIAAAEAAAIGMQMRAIRIRARPERRGDDPWWDWL